MKTIRNTLYIGNGVYVIYFTDNTKEYSTSKISKKHYQQLMVKESSHV